MSGCAKWSRPSWPRSARSSPPRAARCCWKAAGGQDGRGADGGGRRTLHGAALLGRAAGQDGQRRGRHRRRARGSRGRPQGARRRGPALRARHDRLGRGVDRARHGRRGDLTRPAYPARRAGTSGAAAKRARPRAAAGGPRSASSCRCSPERPWPGWPRPTFGPWRRCRARAGHGERRGQAGRTGLPAERDRVRGHRAQGRRPRGGRGAIGQRGAGPGVRDQRRAVLRFGATLVRPQGRSAGVWPVSGWPPAPR